MRADSADPSNVELWKIPVIGPEPPLEQLKGLMSADELSRAGRFVFQKDRDKFIRVRGALRIILGRYLEQPPERIELAYEAGGKPYLAGSLHPSQLRFNVSHSGEIALIAVGFGVELGVDVERIRPDVDLREVAQRFFSPREIQELFSLPAEEQTRGFFNCWTRKEAFVKATGAGLSFPLDQFDVTVRPGEPAALLEVRGGPAERTWTLEDVSPAHDYPAALVVEGNVSLKTVQCEF